MLCQVSGDRQPTTTERERAVDAVVESLCVSILMISYWKYKYCSIYNYPQVVGDLFYFLKKPLKICWKCWAVFGKLIELSVWSISWKGVIHKIHQGEFSDFDRPSLPSHAAHLGGLNFPLFTFDDRFTRFCAIFRVTNKISFRRDATETNIFIVKLLVKSGIIYALNYAALELFTRFKIFCCFWTFLIFISLLHYRDHINYWRLTLPTLPPPPPCQIFGTINPSFPSR